eukprot:Em0002g1211a
MQLLSVTVLLTVALLCKAASIGTLDGGSTSPKYGVTTQQAGGSETTTVKLDGTTAMKSSDTARGQSTPEELVKQVLASDDSTGQKPKVVTVGNTAAAHTDTAVLFGGEGSTSPKVQENEMIATSTVDLQYRHIFSQFLEICTSERHSLEYHCLCSIYWCGVQLFGEHSRPKGFCQML